MKRTNGNFKGRFKSKVVILKTSKIRKSFYQSKRNAGGNADKLEISINLLIPSL
jgi:hypothetical protein